MKLSTQVIIVVLVVFLLVFLRAILDKTKIHIEYVPSMIVDVTGSLG